MSPFNFIVQKLIGCLPAPFRLDFGKRKVRGKGGKRETKKRETTRMEMKGQGLMEIKGGEERKGEGDIGKEREDEEEGRREGERGKEKGGNLCRVVIFFFAKTLFYILLTRTQ